MPLYAFGSNGQGQLGIGHVEDTDRPTPCIGIPDDQIIIKISGGGNHSAVITKEGHLYMTGMSQQGEGPKESNLAWLAYQRRYPQHVWKDVSCGWASTLFLTDQGIVFGVGTSQWYQLAGPSTHELVQVPIDHTIVAISSGWRHSIALDQHGQVYGWGWGKHGQLGSFLGSMDPMDRKKDIRPVHKFNLPQPIVQIACGHLHTLLLGQDGTVYAFGSNKYQQLDQVPTMPVTLVQAGWHHSAALLVDRRLVVWGRGDHGQLGRDGLSDIKQVACGSEHTLVITKDDQVLAWGWNEHGNCSSDQENVTEPLVAFEQKACLVAAGCATSWIVTKN